MILAISFFMFFAFATEPSTRLVEKTLATIENQMVSINDLKIAKKRIKNGFMNQSPLLPIFPKLNKETSDQKILEFLVTQFMLDTVANQIPGLKISDEELISEIEGQRKLKKMSRENFSKFLIEHHFTALSYKDFLRKFLKRKKIVQFNIMDKIKLTDEDLNNYLLSVEKKPLFTSFKYDLEYLVFPLNSSGLTQAKLVLKSLSSNLTQSLKNISKKNDPDVQFIRSKNLSETGMQVEIKKALLPLSIGQYTKVLRLQNGFHIFKILNKVAEIPDSKIALKNQIYSTLFQKTYTRTLNSWLNKHRSLTFIKIHQ